MDAACAERGPMLAWLRWSAPAVAGPARFSGPTPCRRVAPAGRHERSHLGGRVGGGGGKFGRVDRQPMHRHVLASIRAALLVLPVAEGEGHLEGRGGRGAR